MQYRSTAAVKVELPCLRDTVGAGDVDNGAAVGVVAVGVGGAVDDCDGLGDAGRLLLAEDGLATAAVAVPALAALLCPPAVLPDTTTADAAAGMRRRMLASKVSALKESELKCSTTTPLPSQHVSTFAQPGEVSLSFSPDAAEGGLRSDKKLFYLL